MTKERRGILFKLSSGSISKIHEMAKRLECSSDDVVEAMVRRSSLRYSTSKSFSKAPNGVMLGGPMKIGHIDIEENE